MTQIMQVIINLEKSTNAKDFSKSDNSLIHQFEFDKVISWGNEQLNTIKDSEERLHETISILGSRGSGKTSFLLSVLNHYKKEADIEVIDIIDPTLIEEKGHIFLTIISQIKKSVDKKLNKNNVCNPESSQYSQKQIWRDMLKELAMGLPSIDGIGKSADDAWQDAEYIMDKGLRAVQAARDLEYNFHKFVSKSLEILGKKLFVFAFDDIDIDFRKGWPVLETIRKYMTTPQIMTFISGDLHLYSKAIRKQQWKNFGKALIKNEAELLGNISKYNDLVTEMEGQYLQKVMKPEKRIRLKTLKEIIETRQSEILIKPDSINSDSNNIDIVTYYQNILKTFGINNAYEAEAYHSYLLNLPLRTQIQFLTEQKDQGLHNTTDAFLSDLYEKHVNIELASSSPKTILVETLKLLLEEKMLVEAYQLQPTTADTSLNSSLIALSFLYSQRTVKYPALIFEYFIKLGYLRNLATTLDYKENTNSIKSIAFAPSIEGLCKHAELLQDKVLRDVAGNMTAYTRAFLNIGSENNKSWGGTIPLLGLHFKAKDSKSGRIDTVFKNSKLYQRQLAYIPLSTTQPNKSATLLTYSVYGLLATIGELILRSQYNALQDGINELSQIRTYPAPNFQGFKPFKDDVLQEGGDDNQIEQEPDDSLKNIIQSWISTYPKKTVNPHLLGKISSRYFFALNNIDENDTTDNLGDSFHIRIIALMNAILVEDVRENCDGKISLNVDNIRTSDQIFTNNLIKINETGREIKEKLHLSQWLLSCPLLLMYLNTDKEQNYTKPLKTHLSGFKKKEMHEIEDILNLSIHPILKEVHLKGVSKKSTDTANDNEKIKFSGSWTNIDQTISHLNLLTDISYDNFMNSKEAEVIKLCKEFFSNNIGPRMIRSARTNIKKKDIKW